MKKTTRKPLENPATSEPETLDLTRLSQAPTRRQRPLEMLINRALDNLDSPMPAIEPVCH
jgi:hypothetical protein